VTHGKAAAEYQFLEKMLLGCLSAFSGDTPAFGKFATSSNDNSSTSLPFNTFSDTGTCVPSLGGDKDHGTLLSLSH